MRAIQDVIKRPIITEKSTAQREGANQICFEVDPRANKAEIKEAVERLFKVKVVAVNTLRVPGEVRRVGRRAIRTVRPGWKKAYVTLREGDKIEFFEGA
ncbi:MAG TPA: 50S ribosomal protein L23 [Thermodesulfobacteriota bacterium]|nr:50S ribosomal protein L23 [Thermodesulfobacteriota bacterium]